MRVVCNVEFLGTLVDVASKRRVPGVQANRMACRNKANFCVYIELLVNKSLGNRCSLEQRLSRPSVQKFCVEPRLPPTTFEIAVMAVISIAT